MRILRLIAPAAHRRRALLGLLFVALGCGTPVEHEATGDVVSVDPAALAVTVRHDDVPGVMGAMTMRFPVQSAGVLAGVAPRDRVSFVIRRRGDDLVVVRMSVTAAAAPVPPAGETVVPGVHDHTPHHGGVVGMSGMLHLEARARADGTVRVYLTDYFRKPRALGDVSGRVLLELPAGDHELVLAVADDALEAKGAPIAEAEVTAHVELSVGGEAVEMDFLLPTTSASAGAAGVPTEGCVAVPAFPGRRTPRCTLDFGRPISALAATPDGTTLLVAAIDAGVSTWRLPEGGLLHGFEPAPPITVPDVRLMKPHPEGANAIAVHPDGREAVVALENRLLRHDVASGRLIRELPASGGVIRGVDWSPDGGSLIVTTFYDPSARLLRADTGIEWGRLPVEREAAAAAFSPDGRLAAVGSEAGMLTLFTLGGGGPRTLGQGGRAVGGLAFAGERLVAARDGGVVQIWNIGEARLERELETGSASARIAVGPAARILATSAAGPSFQLFDIASSAAPEVRDWHGRDVVALVWAGQTIVSADVAGRVALWD